MRFSLRALFVAMSLLCLLAAFPLFVAGVAALFIACLLAGGIFMLMVVVPFEKLMDKLRKKRVYRD